MAPAPRPRTSQRRVRPSRRRPKPPAGVGGSIGARFAGDDRQQDMPRQMNPQMMNNLAMQQQLEFLRRRQVSASPRPVLDFGKSRPMVQVRIENPSDLPIDANAVKFQQQHIAAMSNLHPQHNNQFRPMSTLQMPQMQTQNVGMVRAQPVKVEGFQELMGGDSTMKHDSDENKLTSPSSK